MLFWAAVTIAAKMAVLLIVGWLYGLRKQALWLFCLSSPQAGEFAFVLIAFGVANAVFAPQFAAQLLLIVALTMLVTPLLFILYDKLIAHAYCTGRGGREADAIEEENLIIIAGRGRVGGIVDRMLDASVNSRDGDRLQQRPSRSSQEVRRLHLLRRCHPAGPARQRGDRARAHP